MSYLGDLAVKAFEPPSRQDVSIAASPRRGLSLPHRLRGKPCFPGGSEAMDLTELAALRQFVGRTQTVTDLLTPVPPTLLAPTIDRDDPPYKAGDELPPNWHRLYFLWASRPAEVGPDGHPERGKFLPPVPLPRRMFAGGRLKFLRPLRIGDTVTRVSEIVSVEGKQGRSGDLVFVTVGQRFSVGDAVALEETQDLVYRGKGGGGEAAPEPVEAAPWQRTIDPDPVMLFRYSALT